MVHTRVAVFGTPETVAIPQVYDRSMVEIWERDAYELADGVRRGEHSAQELLDVFLARIERFDPELNAFCFLDEDAARSRAAEIDAEVARGEDPGAWAGVPMGVKELVAVAGWPDTHASLLYKDQVATADDTEPARLQAGRRGAGRPYDVTRVRRLPTGRVRTCTARPATRGIPSARRAGRRAGAPRRSRSGMMPICTGSDGGGSIRIPSSV